MLSHAEIWRAIDTLAREHNMSPSGLARRAGLDPTTFNKSKRITREGKARWPSTESIAKILRATDSTIEEFVGYLKESEGPSRSRGLPALDIASAAGSGAFDESGHPTGGNWRVVDHPAVSDANAYALEIGDEGLQPMCRAGDVIVVSPGAPVRRGDRVVVRAKGGEILVGEFLQQSGGRTELVPFGAGQPGNAIAVESAAFVHRIIWVSQ